MKHSSSYFIYYIEVYVTQWLEHLTGHHAESYRLYQYVTFALPPQSMQLNS